MRHTCLLAIGSLAVNAQIFEWAQQTSDVTTSLNDVNFADPKWLGRGRWRGY